MSSRPRRSAAQRANIAITDLADRDNKDNERRMSSRPARRSGGSTSVTRGPPSSPGSNGAESPHINVTIKTSSSKLRQATRGTSPTDGKRKTSDTTSAAFAPSNSSKFARTGTSSKQTRGRRQNYVVDSSEEEDDEEEDEEDDEEEEEVVEGESIRVLGRAGLDADDDEEEEEEEEEEEDADADADADEMDIDIDAEGEDEEDGDIEMAIAPPPPAIKVTKPQTPSKGTAAPKPKTTPTKGTVVAKPAVSFDDDEDDEDELSELDSDQMEVENDEDAEGEEEDAEGEEEDAEGELEDAEGEEDAEADVEGAIEVGGADEDDLDSDDELGSRGGTPDLSKLTARQRAKLGEASHEYLKLSDEVQAKKVFTAEEISMRRAEMARRRRNLSEKRNEEVKMETINKLLKKQASKTNRKAAAGDETSEGLEKRADPVFVRWISNKNGSTVSVPDEMLTGPAGQVFIKGGLGSGKMVEEVN
ncbi:PAPA-1-like conserved region-domain-containing protein [Podospora australis]|uniref:PAPA-1-like conserved region-domain-containing protein n=1 Tax=Podospora australis TaxID=1536484 RepID=A0AAN6WNH5_9PEZI|nr:PAPA-1-like conserved region-domain-containing protein [Podospora australis]